MFRLSKEAEKDISEIFLNSFVRFGEEQTDKYFASLMKCISLLGINPDMGTNISDLRHKYFKFPYESHVIFYKIEPENILIVRVLHKHMDVDKIIK